MIPSRIFITGASSGLGEGLARRYAAPGVTLGLVARRVDVLTAVADSARQTGAHVHLFPADVANPAAMRAAAARFLELAGGVDLVIANAGIGLQHPIAEATLEEVAHLFAVNLTGVTNSLLPFLPVMLAARAGTLCAISSMAGHRGLPGHVPYAASKAAVITLMDGLRMELHNTGVHAMTICPGFVHTPMTAGKRKMMFVMSADAAVGKIVGAIARGKRTYSFPWQMGLLKHLMRHAPEWLLRRAMLR